MSNIRNTSPTLYQINTRIWLGNLSQQKNHQVTLGQVPESEIDRFASLGFDWIWLLGVWRTGDIGRQIASQHPDLRREYLATLPDLEEEDICSSLFSITGYSVSSDLGGDNGLAIFRERLQTRGIKLMLDFIPNHTAQDHPWVTLHPDYYIQGKEEQLLKEPYNFGRKPDGDMIFAFGRDPYFPGWSDTFQLDYGNPQLQAAMRAEVSNLTDLCDGVRCDMAMLILPEVFRRTWEIEIDPFWSQAIEQARALNPDFTFMAEVYWDLEWKLQQQGFDYTYDKRLYDRLLQHEARPVREHLMAGLEFQNKSTRFLENHDEPRAANSFPLQVHQAAAMITYLTPGLKFFHQGQLMGHHTRIPMQLCRAPREQPDTELVEFYIRLLELLQLPILHKGYWQLLDCLPAWSSNWTWDSFVAFSWANFDESSVLVVVNYASHQGQCYVRLPWLDLASEQVLLEDKINGVNYIRSTEDLSQFGLYLDMPAWNFHVFEVRRQ
jgi:hypothetical protein